MTKIAVVQMASGPNVQANLMEVGRLIAEAAEQGAGMVVLPENFAIMGLTDQDSVAIAEDEGEGVIQNYVRKLCIKHKIWIVAGTVPVKSDDPERPYASALVFDDQGEHVARYDKIHLFDVELADNESYSESQTIKHGDGTLVFDSPFGRIGIAICYDLRFPEQFRVLVDQGAEIFIVPAAFADTTGKAHWEVLLRARAIENLSYVIASAQGGYHVSGRTTYGHSMMVDFWGNIHEQLGKGAGVILIEPDLEALRKTRQAFPVLQHRIAL